MTVADAVEVIVERGRGTLLAKVDIKSAYRIIPVHPEDHQLLGMLWEGALCGYSTIIWPPVSPQDI